VSRDAESRADTPDQGPDEGAAAGAGREVQGREVDRRDFQAEADRYVAELLGGLPAEQAALALALLGNRVAARLHSLARTEATARKGQPEWPAWAQLQNASRNVVLQASTCRDLALRLTGSRTQSPPEGTTPPDQ
jgi:hypothetical protein